MKTFKLFTLLMAFALLSCTANDNDDVTASSCSTICDYILASGETAGTVPTSLDGTYELTFAKDSQSSNTYYTDGVKGTFTISNNTLTIEVEGKECITLTNPVQTSPSENTFKDTCGRNIAYAVSAKTDGTLNEINAITISNRFLGQFTE
tara:strand:+ start:56568 stop:57017 length:450 start_codon:yes stop_codon:yes gene_type:complete